MSCGVCNILQNCNVKPKLTGSLFLLCTQCNKNIGPDGQDLTEQSSLSGGSDHPLVQVDLCYLNNFKHVISFRSDIMQCTDQRAKLFDHQKVKVCYCQINLYLIFSSLSIYIHSHIYTLHIFYSLKSSLCTEKHDPAMQIEVCV